MPDVKISALPAAASALGADELPINEAGVSKKLTVAQLQNFLATGRGATLPAQPAYGDNVPFFYTTYGMWVHYDGAHWVSDEVVTIPLSASKALPGNITASQAAVLEGALPNSPLGTKLAMWGLNFSARGYAGALNDTTNYWTITAACYPSATSVASVSTYGLAPGTFDLTVGIAAVIVSTDNYVYLDAARVASAGTLDIQAVMHARWIVTQSG